MPPSSVTLHGGPFDDGRLCRIYFPQGGDRGIRCWFEVKSDVRREVRGFGELVGGLCVILLLLPDLEYISGDEPLAYPAQNAMQGGRTGYHPGFEALVSIPLTPEHCLTA